MNLAILDKMCCPFDKSELELKIFRKEGNKVIEGMLICPVCHRYYPIITGIPIMVPDEYREPKFEQAFLNRWVDEIPKSILDKKYLLH